MTERSTSLGEFSGLGGQATARSMGTPLPGASQVVTIGAAATYSTLLPAGSHLAVTCTSAAFVRCSTTLADAAVVNTDMYVQAGGRVIIRLGRDASNVAQTYLSVIQSTAGGFMYVTPMEGNQY